MAAAVSRGNTHSSSLSVPMKENRKKRKFRADSLSPDLCQVFRPQNDVMTCELPSESPSGQQNLENHSSSCNLCPSSMDDYSLDEQHVEDLRVGWDTETEAKLKNLLLRSLESIFKIAIRKIFSHGFTEEVATRAVLTAGFYYGDKDAVSNIVDNILDNLNNGSVEYRCFENFEQLHEYVLAEMIYILMAVCPFLSTGDAMWFLLLCDMNVSDACKFDINLRSSLRCDHSRDGRSESKSKPDSKSSRITSSSMDFDGLQPDKTNPLISSFHNTPQPELPVVNTIPGLPTGRFSAKRISEGFKSTPKLEQSKFLRSSNASQTASLKEKFLDGRRESGGTFNRESGLLKELIDIEKIIGENESKDSWGTMKLGGHCNFIFDSKGKYFSASKDVGTHKNPMGLSKYSNQNKNRLGRGTSGSSPGKNSLNNHPSSYPTFNTGHSSREDGNQNPNHSLKVEFSSGFFQVPSNRRGGHWLAKNRRDEILQKLVPTIKELKAKLQGWTDWANETVSQAANILRKNKAELVSLRREKEAMIHLKKERKTLENRSLKRLAELDKALKKASQQVYKTKASIEKLRGENVRLRYGVEAAKSYAAEAAASFQEVSSGEVKMSKQIQYWDRERAFLQAGLLTKRRKQTQVQQQVTRAEEDLDQLEARRIGAKKKKEEALKQACMEREEQELMEASASSKEEAMRSKAKDDLSVYKAEIRRLEDEISQLKLGVEPTYPKWEPHRSEDGEQEQEGEGVRRERECVMCLCEEMSVVFLPCAHQVVCCMCNELHEKQGMRECPSCRTPIQRRIQAQFAPF